MPLPFFANALCRPLLRPLVPVLGALVVVLGMWPVSPGRGRALARFVSSWMPPEQTPVGAPTDL